MRNMHADQAGIKKIACTICGEEFVRQFYLKKHMALKVGSYLTPFLALRIGFYLTQWAGGGFNPPNF